MITWAIMQCFHIEMFIGGQQELAFTLGFQVSSTKEDELSEKREIFNET